MPSWGQCSLLVGGTSWWPASEPTDVSLGSSASCLTAPAVAEREGLPPPADTVGPVVSLPGPLSLASRIAGGGQARAALQHP